MASTVLSTSTVIALSTYATIASLRQVWFISTGLPWRTCRAGHTCCTWAAGKSGSGCTCGHYTANNVVVRAAVEVYAVYRHLCGRGIAHLNGQILQSETTGIETRESYQCVRWSRDDIGRRSADDRGRTIALYPCCSIKSSFQRHIRWYLKGGGDGIGASGHPDHRVSTCGQTKSLG
jgi:hypothetical protein